MLNVYDKRVCKNLEKTCFYPNGKILERSTDTILLDKLNQFHQPQQSVLDYGGGTGRMLDLMVKKKMPASLNYHHFDTSEDMVTLARAKFNTLPPAAFTSDKKQLEQSYDYLICNDVLNHSNGIDQFEERLIQFNQLSSKASFFHFWIGQETKHLIYERANQKFDEFWISKEDLELIAESTFNDYEIIYGDQEQPYPTALLIVYKSNEPLVVLEEDIEFDQLEEEDLHS